MHMDENEIDRASQRANLIEQRMFEITLSSIDTIKHSTAVQLHKSQNEMKKRLRKYRDRQREIVRSRPGFDKDPIEELMSRQIKNNSKNRKKARPKTSPCGQRKAIVLTPKVECKHRGNGIVSSNGLSPRTRTTSETCATERSDIGQRGGKRAVSSCNGRSTKVRGDSLGDGDPDCDSSDSDIELDSSFMIDQQKSKIDLRPKTAVDIARRGVTLDKYVNIGRLGPPVRQIRYFDQDELKDRGHFYRHLVEKRIDDEKCKLDSLNDKVAQFCGSETIQTMTRKIQAKRKFFTRNPEWEDKVSTKMRAKTAHPGNRKRSVFNLNTKSRSETVIRPSTSAGFSSSQSAGIADIKSFRKPSYIATSH